MYRVSISARIIRWPGFCACCCGPADTSIDVSSTRTTGVKVVRSQTKSWSVPYCGRCLDHVALARRLSRFGWVVVHRPAVAVVLTVGAVAAAVPLLLALPVFPALLIGLILAVGLGYGLYAAFPWCVRTHREELRRRDRARRALEERLDQCTCDGCAREDSLAAEYGGWSGSIHTFYFANRRFADLFCRANAGKILG